MKPRRSQAFKLYAEDLVKISTEHPDAFGLADHFAALASETTPECRLCSLPTSQFVWRRSTTGRERTNRCFIGLRSHVIRCANAKVRAELVDAGWRPASDLRDDGKGKVSGIPGRYAAAVARLGGIANTPVGVYASGVFATVWVCPVAVALLLATSLNVEWESERRVTVQNHAGLVADAKRIGPALAADPVAVAEVGATMALLLGGKLPVGTVEADDVARQLRPLIGKLARARGVSPTSRFWDGIGPRP